jgi:cytochrome c biogenesis protein CcdA/thiol-disulfide isomerase/thioredoxin
MTILLTLFAAGVLTILLPCILPLVPIVLGVSLSGRSKWRPLVTSAGMVVSFVVFTFVLQILLRQLVHLADLIRIATYYALFLFGICFLTTRLRLQIALAILGAVPFFWNQGWLVLLTTSLLGAAAVALGGRVAVRLQQVGVDVQKGAESGLGRESLLSAFVVGLTLGLVWVPCAGPALGFALTLVREGPGARAFLALTAYAVGAALPLLCIGYGGQSIVRAARGLSRYSGRIKQVSGGLLVLSAAAFQFQWFLSLQTWLADHANFGNAGTAIEDRIFGKATAAPQPAQPLSSAAATNTGLPLLPKLADAPEFAGLGPWYNSTPLTLASLKGNIVLVDFWTYSCVNCIRTLPHMNEFWSRYKDQPFVIVGVHSPEFVFEKKPENVASAIKQHSLGYPIAQDNEFATWNAFNNHYWPAKYLIDAQGIIRYTHFGEGEDEATDLAIRSLLAELGHVTGRTASARIIPAAMQEMRISPETYLGSRGWTAFANNTGAPDAQRHGYVAPNRLSPDRFALVGDWQLVDDERQVLRSEVGEIRYHALAGEVNLVLGIEKGAAAVVVDVIVDGTPGKAITVDHHDLYNLYAGPYGDHEVTLKIRGKDVAAYAFTFGGSFQRPIRSCGRSESHAPSLLDMC